MDSAWDQLALDGRIIPRALVADDVNEDDATTDLDNLAAQGAAHSPTMKEQVRRFIALTRAKREAEAQMKTIDQELGPLSQQLIDAFAATGTHSEQVDGMTVYVTYTTWARARDGDQARLCAALQESGYADLVQPRANIQTVSALVRELRAEAMLTEADVETILPQAVMDALVITTDAQLKARKGKRIPVR